MATPRAGVRATIGVLLTVQAACLAQHEPNGVRSDGADDAARKRGAAAAPAHLPHPELRPATALAHLQQGHAAFLAARAGKQPVPPPAERPAGAGRYVAAVLCCPDADLDAHELFGLARRDVLCIQTPGPFATAETIALLEHLVEHERLSLVVVLGHESCALQRARQGASAARRDLDRRLATFDPPRGADAAALRALLLAQRETLIAASEPMRLRCAADRLRIVPGIYDPRTSTLGWFGQRIDAMPLAPVK